MGGGADTGGRSARRSPAGGGADPAFGCGVGDGAGGSTEGAAAGGRENDGGDGRVGGATTDGGRFTVRDGDPSSWSPSSATGRNGPRWAKPPAGPPSSNRSSMPATGTAVGAGGLNGAGTGATGFGAGPTTAAPAGTGPAIGVPRRVRPLLPGMADSSTRS